MWIRRIERHRVSNGDIALKRVISALDKDTVAIFGQISSVIYLPSFGLDFLETSKTLKKNKVIDIGYYEKVKDQLKL